MGYIRHHLESITGVGIYPLISLLIFFLFFVTVTLYVLRADKKFIDYMAQRPLGNNDNDPSI